jgi:hypothetical protein
MTTKKNKLNEKFTIWIYPFLTLLINLTLAIFTYLLFKETQNTFKEARNEYDSQNKPYILYRALGIHGFKVDSTIVTTLRFENYGKSIAQIISQKYRFEASSIYPLASFTYPNYNTGYDAPIYIAPQDGSNVITNSNAILTYDDSIRIADRREFVYFHGEITYKSLISTNIYVYKFCFLLIPNGRFKINKTHNGIEDVGNDDAN